LHRLSIRLRRSTYSAKVLWRTKLDLSVPY
jgi:hypothetical protein